MAASAFEINKNSKQLGIDTSRTFVVVSQEHTIGSFPIGAVVKPHGDDGTDMPAFRLVKPIGDYGVGSMKFIRWSDLAYSDGFRAGATICKQGSSDCLVLETIGDVCFLKGGDDTTRAYPHQISRLKADGWKMKDATPREMTVEEVSRLVGQEVKIVDKK